MVLLCLAAISVFGCASKVLKVENSEQILATKEYEEALEVKSLPTEAGLVGVEPGAYVRADAPSYTPPPGVAPSNAAGKRRGRQSVAPQTPSKTKSRAESAAVGTAEQRPTRRQPELEDDAGFQGRRPLADPFRVGEVVTLEVSSYGIVAGDMTIEVRPFKQVNGRKAYHFVGTAKTGSFFSRIYTVNDWFETFVDYDELIPYNYALHVEESKQLRVVRSFFDWQKKRGFVWDRKIPKGKPLEEKKYEWEILPFSQNVFTAPYYIRTFQLEPGKKIQFRLGHEGKNIVVTGDVLRREKIKTVLGELSTVVVRPQIEIDGVFKPMGEILLWFTDDDRKFLVRIESKIRIGTINAKVKSIEKGL